MKMRREETSREAHAGRGGGRDSSNRERGASRTEVPPSTGLNPNGTVAHAETQSAQMILALLRGGRLAGGIRRDPANPDPGLPSVSSHPQCPLRALRLCVRNVWAQREPGAPVFSLTLRMSNTKGIAARKSSPIIRNTSMKLRSDACFWTAA